MRSKADVTIEKIYVNNFNQSIVGCQDSCHVYSFVYNIRMNEMENILMMYTSWQYTLLKLELKKHQ